MKLTRRTLLKTIPLITLRPSTLLAFEQNLLDRRLMELVVNGESLADIEKVLKEGANPNSLHPNPNNVNILWSPLHAAVNESDEFVAVTLMQNGADPDIWSLPPVGHKLITDIHQNGCIERPLMIAKKKVVAQALLRYGATLNWETFKYHGINKGRVYKYLMTQMTLDYQGVFYYGGSGTGKTKKSIALANSLLKTKRFERVFVFDDFDQYRDVIDKNGFSKKSVYVNQNMKGTVFNNFVRGSSKRTLYIFDAFPIPYEINVWQEMEDSFIAAARNPRNKFIINGQRPMPNFLWALGFDKKELFRNRYGS